MDTPVGEIATFPVLHVDEGDFLFNAMVMMTRQRIKRVMVCLGNQAVGLLSLIQILSAFSTHSHVLTLAIARAASIDELALAANKQRELVESLMSRGVRTRFVMELIAAVNEQIIEKAFELVVPPALHDQCCLVVLGSEGRGEQILKPIKTTRSSFKMVWNGTSASPSWRRSPIPCCSSAIPCVPAK